MKNVSLILIAVTLALALVPEQGKSQRQETFYESGNAFARGCSSMNKQTAEMTPDEIGEGVKCAIYVKGLFDGIQSERTRVLVTEPARVLPAFFCEQSFTETENGQVVRILLKYIRDNPEKANQPLGALFMFAMRESFPPCAMTNR